MLKTNTFVPFTLLMLALGAAQGEAKASELNRARLSAITIGGISSGGGDALFCSNVKQGAATVRLLDLVEGEAEGDTHLDLELDMEAALELALGRLEATGYAAVSEGQLTLAERVEHILVNLQLLRDGTLLEDIEDSFHSLKAPSGCAIRQIAAFLNPETIIVDGTLWDGLPSLDRAALILHEALYWQFREQTGLQDSRRTRHVVSKVLSQNWSPDHRLDATGIALQCEATASSEDSEQRAVFTAQDKPQGGPQTGLWVRFSSLGGVAFLSEREALFPSLSTSALEWASRGFTPEALAPGATVESALEATPLDPGVRLRFRAGDGDHDPVLTLEGFFQDESGLTFQLDHLVCRQAEPQRFYPPGLQLSSDGPQTPPALSHLP